MSGRFFSGIPHPHLLGDRAPDSFFDLPVYTTDPFSRHGRGSSLTFTDGHAAWFKYTYMCLNTPAKAADAGVADISWTADGHVVP